MLHPALPDQGFSSRSVHRVVIVLDSSASMSAFRKELDLGLREKLTLAPLCLLMLWIGVAPQAFLTPSRPALESTLSAFQARLKEPAPTSPTLRAAAKPAASPRSPGGRRGGARA